MNSDKSINFNETEIIGELYKHIRDYKFYHLYPIYKKHGIHYGLDGPSLGIIRKNDVIMILEIKEFDTPTIRAFKILWTNKIGWFWASIDDFLKDFIKLT